MESLNPEYSQVGSTKRQLEISTMSLFNRYLEEMEDRDSTGKYLTQFNFRLLWDLPYTS